MKRSRPKPRPDADPAFGDFVHQLPCAAPFQHTYPCEGRIEADHAGKKVAMSRKAPENTRIPMCTLHHRNRHEFTGPFRYWDKVRMRIWLDEQIAITRAAFEAVRRAA